ncbi:MAG: hypothetical protein N2049_01995 [Anaerolineales bacterium]|nr:hypothetical protein [Anaerolineales bacterium]MCX7607978.1 hypothetical protein [Anaerolineales bacterium]MDW8227616.1 hypothetical protein [Anaerolineales bacterium]
MLVLAFVLYLHLWPHAPVPGNDTAAYIKVAQDLRDFRLDTFQVRPPGYGWLLMLTGSTTAPTRFLLVAQLVMHLGWVGLLLFLLEQAQVNRILIGAFTLLALLPYNVLPVARALTESQSQFLLVWGIGLFVLWLNRGKWLHLVWGAFFLAFLGITRPVFQFFPPVLALLAILLAPKLRNWRKRLLWGAAGLSLWAILIIGSLAFHNLHYHGYFGVSPLTGLHLTQKTGRVLERLPDSYARIREVLIHYRDQSLLSEPHQFYNYIWKIPMDELRPEEGMSYAEISAYYTRLNLVLIAKAPLIYLQEVGYSLVNYLAPMNNRLSDFSMPVLKIVWPAMHYLTLLVLLFSCLFLGGIFLLWLGLSKEQRVWFVKQWDVADRLRRSLLVLAGIAFTYNTLITILIEMGDPRTRLPVEPMILLIGILGLDEWLRLRSTVRECLQAYQASQVSQAESS